MHSFKKEAEDERKNTEEEFTTRKLSFGKKTHAPHTKCLNKRRKPRNVAARQSRDNEDAHGTDVLHTFIHSQPVSHSPAWYLPTEHPGPVWKAFRICSETSDFPAVLGMNFT